MSSTISAISDFLNLQEPASFREFVAGEEYCNNPYLYEYWYTQDMRLPETLNELILTGSLGAGKSYYAAYKLAYIVYRLFFNGSPQKQLGLAENTDIFCIYFSVSLSMAKASGFNYLYDIFLNCKWFKQYAPINHDLKSAVEFKDRHFTIKFASGESHQIGLNVFAFILDEANFRSGVGLGLADEYKEVTLLYQQLLDRQLSRFSRPDGSTNSLAILISSASYQSAFVETRRQAIQGNPNAACIVSTSYEATPEKFSPETFEVFIGAGVAEPQIIESEEQRMRILESAKILGSGEEDTFFRKVPVNLKPAFMSNIVLALQNHCGVATNISTSFISNLKYLYQSYTDDIPSVFVSETLTASNNDDTELSEYFLYDGVQYAERPHSLFLDLSIQSDPGAITMYRYDGKDGSGKDMHTRVFSVDIIPPPFPEQTEITKVKNLVFFLSEIFNIVAFATDQYQSTQLRQDVCKELGLDDIRVSLDSSDVPYLLWQSALVSGRIRQTADPTLEKEVQSAVHDWKRRRVIKQSKGHDDRLQSNVGAFFLSDTVGKNYESVDDLYEDNRINLIGSKSMERVYRELGFK